MQHSDKQTCNVRLKKNRWNIENKSLQHTCTTIATYATFESTFATSIWNTSNIPLKHLKHLKQMLATCAFKHNIYLLLRRLESWNYEARRLESQICNFLDENGGSSTWSSTLVWSLMLRSDTEVASVKLGGSTDLGRDAANRWSEAATGGVSTGGRHGEGEICPASKGGNRGGAGRVWSITRAGARST
jgi:hypothetical protein